MDREHLHFDIDEDDLLDDNKGVFMVDTHSSSLCELLTSRISQDADIEKGEVPYSTQHLLEKLKEKDEQIDYM